MALFPFGARAQRGLSTACAQRSLPTVSHPTLPGLQFLFKSVNGAERTEPYTLMRGLPLKRLRS